jgi:hypothetical protein
MEKRNRNDTHGVRSLSWGGRSPWKRFIEKARVRREGASLWWSLGLLLGALCALWGAHLWLSSKARTREINPAPVILPSIPDDARPEVRALAEAVLRAIHRGDRAALEELLLTQEEFCSKLWPALPPTPNLSCRWAWSAYAPQNTEGLHRVLQEHGGRAYALLRVEPQRVVSYGDVRVYERVRLIVVDESGRERSVCLFGSICQLGRAFRICSFILD